MTLQLRAERNEPHAHPTAPPAATQTAPAPPSPTPGGVRLTGFAPPLVAIRWGTLAVGFALASSDITGTSYRILGCGVILLAYTILRSVRPLRYTDDTASLLRVLAELGLTVLVVVATGYWESPYVFSLITAVIAAGYARGFGFATRISIVSALAVALPYISRAADADDPVRRSAQWGVLLLLVAMVAGYARRISTESAQQHSLALDRLGRLAEANALLFSLHRVAQSLPSSLDLDEVLDSAMSRLRDLVTFDSAGLLLFEDTDNTWVPARWEGVRVTGGLTTEELAPPLRRAMDAATSVSVPNLLETGGPGFAPGAGSGVYAALRARGSIVGVIALEARDARKFGPRDTELLNGFIEPVALAVDNARWFGRLRTIGADEERTRIARDLHDRIGQSLAYLAFELDRIVRAAERGDDLGEALPRLREDVRGVIREVRDTLYDLRTDVSEAQDLTSTMREFLDRVAERSGLEVTVRSDEQRRLPLPQEREMWRIAKEAVMNVERHARATQLAVTWRTDAERAELVISDNGVGFARGTAGRLDSYGILGMRERAASIGARLELESTPGTGTTVRVVVRTAPPTWPT